MAAVQDVSDIQAECMKTVVIKQHHATDATQLTLKVNDIVFVLEQDETGWWGGFMEGQDHTGWFPGSCVRPVPTEPTPAEASPPATPAGEVPQAVASPMARQPAEEAAPQPDVVAVASPMARQPTKGHVLKMSPDKMGGSPLDADSPSRRGNRLVASPCKGHQARSAEAGVEAGSLSWTSASTTAVPSAAGSSVDPAAVAQAVAENDKLKKENAELSSRMKALKRQSDADRGAVDRLEREAEQEKQRTERMEESMQQERELKERLERELQAQREQLEREKQAYKAEQSKLLAQAADLQEQLLVSERRNSQAERHSQAQAAASRAAANTSVLSDTGGVLNMTATSDIQEQRQRPAAAFAHPRTMPRLPSSGSVGYPIAAVSSSPGASPGARSLGTAPLSEPLKAEINPHRESLGVTTERPPCEEPAVGSVSSKVTLFKGLMQKNKVRSASCCNLRDRGGERASFGSSGRQSSSRMLPRAALAPQSVEVAAEPVLDAEIFLGMSPINRGSQ